MQRHMKSRTWKPHEDTKLETILSTEKNCRLKTMPGHYVIKKNTLKNTTDLFCVGHLLLCIGPDLKCSLYTQRDAVEEN